MIKDVIQSITAAARKLFTNWGALLISFLIYDALIAVLYFFFTTREATRFQVALSLIVFPIAAVILFFTLQAMGVSYVRVGVGPFYLLRRALRDCWRLLIVSLPVVFLAWLVVYSIKDPDPKAMNGFLNANEISSNLATLLWYLLLYFLLPLFAIHLWIAAAREGLKSALRGFFYSLGRAFSPRSLLIYIPVVAIFGAIAWFLFFTKTHIKSEWGELWLFGLRFSLALIAIFLGWMITLGAMAEMTARRVMGELET